MSYGENQKQEKKRDKFYDPKDVIHEDEFEAHKDKCSNTFKKFEVQMGELNRAVFGEAKLKQKGMLEMVSEIHQSATLAKGGERIFWMATKISGGIITLAGGFYIIVKVIKAIVAMNVPK